MTETELTEIRKCRAIVMFGPATDTSGNRAGTYFQVTIDPSMVSPGGDYIRFGQGEGDEIHGWQKVSCITVCEILGYYDSDSIYPEANMRPEQLHMMKIVAPTEAQPIEDPA